MNGNTPGRQELADFLRRATRGEPPLHVRSRGGVLEIHDSRACSADLSLFLAGISGFPPPEMERYKSGERSIVGSMPAPDGTRVVLKYYQPGKPYKHLTYGILGSRCMRSWIAGLAFRHLGLPTPPPLFVSESRRLGGIWFSKACLATSLAPGIDLRTWIGLHSGNHERLAAMAERLRAVFDLMGRYGINHGDPKASNILVSDDDSLSFIDLDAAEFLTTGSRWRALRRRDKAILENIVSKHPAAAPAFGQLLREL